MIRWQDDSITFKKIIKVIYEQNDPMSGLQLMIKRLNSEGSGPQELETLASLTPPSAVQVVKLNNSYFKLIYVCKNELF